jgi:hypothetical protein
MRFGPVSDLFLNQLGYQLRLILSAQMSNSVWRRSHFLKVASQLIPDFFSLFSFCQIEFRNQFLNALYRNRFTIVVVIFDDFLLVARKIFHGHVGKGSLGLEDSGATKSNPYWGREIDLPKDLIEQFSPDEEGEAPWRGLNFGFHRFILVAILSTFGGLYPKSGPVRTFFRKKPDYDRVRFD